jgi:hypothetical protein
LLAFSSASVALRAITHPSLDLVLFVNPRPPH